METKASYIVTGAFTLTVIAGVFGFLYWVQNGAGGGSERSTYRVVFAGSVSGLRPGAAVLFDGMRVGEVTKLALDPHDPRRVEALIALDRATPVRADTKVALAFQGLTGLADVSLAGGAPDAAPVALDKRTDEISTGLVRFSNSGLKEYEAFAVEGRRTLVELHKAIKNINDHPSQLIFGR